MKTCQRCESISRNQLLMESMSPNPHINGEETRLAYNARLEELRVGGYEWVPEAIAMVKQCAECAAAPEETRDETSGAEDQDTPTDP